MLLSASWPLYLAVLLSDVAYASTYELQWKNFASWLLVGALTFSGVVLLLALVQIVRRGPRARFAVFYALLLLLAWVLGFANALVHAKDAWASMPESVMLSTFAAALLSGAMWLRLVPAGAGELE